MLNEDEVRALVRQAVHDARSFTPGNMSDEAIISRTMMDRYGSQGWRSRWFEEENSDSPVGR